MASKHRIITAAPLKAIVFGSCTGSDGGDSACNMLKEHCSALVTGIQASMDTGKL